VFRVRLAVRPSLVELLRLPGVVLVRPSLAGPRRLGV
jgi:hypothetical protein